MTDAARAAYMELYVTVVRAWNRSMGPSVGGKISDAVGLDPDAMVERMADEILELRKRLKKEMTGWEDRNGD